MSSCESELGGAVEATKSIIWLRDMLEFFDQPQREPTTLFADNTSMITLASNHSGQSKRMKHSMQKIHFMLEQVHNSLVRLAYLRTDNHTADIPTKPLPPLIHWHHVGPLLGETPAIARAKEEVFRLKGRTICMRADIVVPAIAPILKIFGSSSRRGARRVRFDLTRNQEYLQPSDWGPELVPLQSYSSSSSATPEHSTMTITSSVPSVSGSKHARDSEGEGLEKSVRSTSRGGNRHWHQLRDNSR